MLHIPHLILDLALILGAAAVTTLIFKRLQQPVVLGYIVAGFLVGPNFSLFPTITEMESIKIWAEIGVIFLLFSLGLEFSFKKLIKVGGSAAVTAIVEVAFMVMIGYFTGQLLGWSGMDSIFLGGILSISSTTIIIRAFDELGIKSQKFVGLVFGALIVEDLVAILLLVLLSTIAVSQQFSGVEMLMSVAKLSFFLVLWFLSGIFILPSFLKRSKKLLNDETLLIVAVSLCLFMVYLATAAGFSPALGAFIMGSILAETTYAEKIEHITKSVKDLFGAVFFVSVGMLINPQTLAEYIGPILLITFVTVAGKFLSSSIGAIASGQSLKTSIQTGLSLSQIGEFSFIIATLGLTLKVTSEFLYPIAVAVSAITTFSTPYLIKVSERVYNIVESKLPRRWIIWLNRYESSTQSMDTVSDWKVVLRSYLSVILLNSVIIISVILLSYYYLGPFIKKNITNGMGGSIIASIITLLLMAPFLWALGGRKLQNKSYSSLWVDRRYNNGPLISLELLRVALAIFFIGFLLNQFFSTGIAFLIGLPVSVLLLFIFSQKIQSFYSKLEKRFLINFNEREIEHRLKSNNHLVPWDAHLATITVLPESRLIGKSLFELRVRETYGVNIALIERGSIIITAPGRSEKIFPGDKLSVIGTDLQLEAFRKVVEPFKEGEIIPKKPDISLKKFLIKGDSELVFKTIREAGIREKTMGLVVGIERGGKRILNPDSNLVFQIDDIVWIVGNNEKIDKLRKEEVDW